MPAAAEAVVRQQIDKLKLDHKGILDCQVTAEVPAPYTEGRYQIKIACHMPDHLLVVDRLPHTDCYQEDINVAIWSAFSLARQQIKQHLLRSVGFTDALQHS
jgi:hypothetical protein